jgi:hydrogenase maturation protease
MSLGSSRMKSRLLVLGVGNVLMGDEGVGVHAVTRMQADYTWPGDVNLVDGGTGGFHLLSLLQEHDPVIMIDASADGRPAGTVGVLTPRFASDFPPSLSAHDIGLRDLVEATVLLGRLPEIHLVTVSIGEVAPMHLTLSPDVERAMPKVIATVRTLVASFSTCMNSGSPRVSLTSCASTFQTARAARSAP